MLKIILFLVLPLIVCEAAVLFLSLKKPQGYDKVVQNEAKKQIYCDSDHVIHCFMQERPVKLLGISAQAAAVVYKDAECSVNAGTEAELIAYLMMDSCQPEENTNIHVSGDGNQIEAWIPRLKNVWVHCKIISSSSNCIKKPTALIAGSTWTLYVPPKPTKPKAQPKVVGKKPVKNEVENIPLEEDIPLEEEVHITEVPLKEEKVETKDIEIKSDKNDDDNDVDEVNDKKKVRFYIPKNKEKVYCDKGAYQCLSCSSVRVCFPDPTDPTKFVESERHSCTTRYPYCNYTLGMCDSNPDPECFNPPNTEQAKNFFCMHDGFYPDPKSCSSFYVCKDRIAYVHRCPKSPVPHYHPRLKMCVNNQEICTNVHSSKQCLDSKNFARKVPIKETTNLFLYCGMNKNVFAVDRCIGAYYFDEVEQMCLFRCPSIGNFMSIEDCGKFIRCSPKPEGGFKMTNIDCPQGQGFLEEEYACVDRSRVPNCHRSVDSFVK